MGLSVFGRGRETNRSGPSPLAGIHLRDIRRGDRDAGTDNDGPMAEPSRPDWLLIDGSSLIFRAFYGVPQTTRAPDGTLVNAVRGTLDTLARLITERRPKRTALATDEDWRPDWRVELLPSYKEHRTAEPVPPLLEPQMPVIIDCL